MRQDLLLHDRRQALDRGQTTLDELLGPERIHQLTLGELGDVEDQILSKSLCVPVRDLSWSSNPNMEERAATLEMLAVQRRGEGLKETCLSDTVQSIEDSELR